MSIVQASLRDATSPVESHRDIREGYDFTGGMTSQHRSTLHLYPQRYIAKSLHNATPLVESRCSIAPHRDSITSVTSQHIYALRLRYGVALRNHSPLAVIDGTFLPDD